MLSELITQDESDFQLKHEFRSFLTSLLDTIENLFENKKWLHIGEPFARPRWMATFEVESVPGNRFLSKVEAEALLRKLGELRQENPSNHYRVLGKLGEGGFARIFEVERFVDKKICALKFIEPKNQRERDKFANEIAVQKYLSGIESICQLIEAYAYKDRIWIFMEYVEGENLTRIV